MAERIVEYFYWTKEHHILAATSATLFVLVHEFWKWVFRVVRRRIEQKEPCC